MKELPKDLPKVGQGIMRFDNIYSKEAILKYQKIIDYMMEQGCNYFEAATFYLNHHCEDLLRHLLRKYPRESYYLADKMDPREFLDKPDNTSYKDFFLHFFFNQLNKLKTDYFDFYLFQALDRNCIQYLTNKEIFSIINILKEKKKINYIGFSFHDAPEYLEYFLDLYDWDFIQIQLNYYNYYNGISKQLYEIAEKRNIPIFVMGSTQGGMLSNLPESINLDNTGFHTSTEIAINFLKKLKNVHLVLNGTNTLEETKQNISFWNKEIIPFNEIEIVKKINDFNFIDCTGCGYCIQKCPKGVDIKELFYLYNNITKGQEHLKKNYLNLYISDKGPSNCIHCGKCEIRCPQHLDIRNKLDFLVMKFRA